MNTATAPGLATRITETALVDGAFTLADGQRLAAYFDEFRLAGDPRLLADVAAAMVPLLPSDTQAVAGLALGGVPLAVALSAASGLPAVFVRAAEKTYGSRRQIEGTPTVTRQRTVLVDDVVRSGSQLLRAARVLRIAGASVSHALCVLERPLGGRQLLTEHHVTLQSLLTESDLSPAIPAGRPR